MELSSNDFEQLKEAIDNPQHNEELAKFMDEFERIEWEEANRPTGICETCTDKAVQEADKFRSILIKVKELLSNNSCDFSENCYSCEYDCPVVESIRIIKEGLSGK